MGLRQMASRLTAVVDDGGRPKHELEQKIFELDKQNALLQERLSNPVITNTEILGFYHTVKSIKYVLVSLVLMISICSVIKSGFESFSEYHEKPMDYDKLSNAVTNSFDKCVENSIHTNDIPAQARAVVYSEINSRCASQTQNFLAAVIQISGTAVEDKQLEQLEKEVLNDSQPATPYP